MNRPDPAPRTPPPRARIDKWLWAARFYKTRGLAAEEVERGRVRVNGAEVKPSREVRPGDCLDIRTGHVTRTVHVRAISLVRGPASVAATLYEETEQSIQARQRLAEQGRLAPEPGLDHTQGRPTKRERRALDRMSDTDARRPRAPGNRDEPGWGDRWSASLDS